MPKKSNQNSEAALNNLIVALEKVIQLPPRNRQGMGYDAINDLIYLAKCNIKSIKKAQALKKVA